MEIEKMVPVDLNTDHLVQLEKCEKGGCLKLKTQLEKKKNKIFMPELTDKLITEAGRLTGDNNPGGFGESKQNASGGCWLTKKLMNANINGWYWIKNHCQTTAHKV